MHSQFRIYHAETKDFYGVDIVNNRTSVEWWQHELVPEFPQWLINAGYYNTQVVTFYNNVRYGMVFHTMRRFGVGSIEINPHDDNFYDKMISDYMILGCRMHCVKRGFDYDSYETKLQYRSWYEEFLVDLPVQLMLHRLEGTA